VINTDGSLAVIGLMRHEKDYDYNAAEMRVGTSVDGRIRLVFE